MIRKAKEIATSGPPPGIRADFAIVLQRYSEVTRSQWVIVTLADVATRHNLPSPATQCQIPAETSSREHGLFVITNSRSGINPVWWAEV
jgi:hypothetical protein